MERGEGTWSGNGLPLRCAAMLAQHANPAPRLPCPQALADRLTAQQAAAQRLGDSDVALLHSALQTHFLFTSCSTAQMVNLYKLASRRELAANEVTPVATPVATPGREAAGMHRQHELHSSP